MFRYVLSVFSSPEKFIQLMSRQDINEAIADGDRIIIDEDGNASVNVTSDEVREDFARHVNALKGV